jgi:hypothetical protein
VTEWTAPELRELCSRVEASPHVARLSEGSAGVVAAYLPGDRVPGIRITSDGRLEVHVVMAWGATVDQVEADVSAVFDPPDTLAGLFIDDVAVPGEDTDDPEAIEP